MSKQRTLLAGLMVVIGAVAPYRGRLRPWMYRWGADDDEVTGTLPGDDLVAANTPTTTRAVTIDAPIPDVWPWLAQIGEDRGGFYSYSMLERAVGAHIHNANIIHPGWQDIGVGDTVWLARRYGDSARMVVAAVKPNSHLVLTSPDDFERVRHGSKATGTWGFYLREQDGCTRLLMRGSGGAVGHAAFDIPHFLMEQKMMRGIRHRAEQVRRAQLNAVVRREYQNVRTGSSLVT
jgi:hypothetical protein